MAQAVELGEAEVHVWGIDPQTVTDPDLLARYAQVLSPDEQERRRRLRLGRMRHDYLVAHALLRASLSRYADVAPEQWTFRTNRHGRPEISGPAEAPPLSFNLSHTDGLVVCAVTSKRAVGVDVEDCSRSLRFMDVARRFFAPSEVEALQRAPESERASAFFTFWTLKEAYIKALGLGLAAPLERFSFRLEAPAPPSISFADSSSDPGRWCFSLFHPTERHVVALAVEQSAGVPTQARLRLTVPLDDGHCE
jgi:4'-phosphopantetheinyl transferase